MNKASDVDPSDRKQIDSAASNCIRDKNFADASKCGNVLKSNPKIARKLLSSEAFNPALAAVTGIARRPQVKASARTPRQSMSARG